MKRALIIGGTGTISSAVVRRLALLDDWELWVINRGRRTSSLPEGVHKIICDIHDESSVVNALSDMMFDSVCEFIGFTIDDVERDYRLFRDKAEQYIFVSSASVYKKPPEGYIVNEDTPVENPFWLYSRNKINCENYLMTRYREDRFPVTIVRPSHTYDEKHIPTSLHGVNGFWQVIKRIQDGKPVIIPEDGTSLWTATFNTDFAVGFTGIMGDPRAIGEAFQITGDESLTWNQIYMTIAEEMNVRLVPFHVSSDFLAAAGEKYGYNFRGNLHGDKSNTVIFDNSKLKSIVPEMRTSVTFRQGVRKAIDYVLAHPEECQKEDPEFDAWCDRVVQKIEILKSSI